MVTMSYPELARLSYLVIDDDENTCALFSVLLKHVIQSQQVKILNANDDFDNVIGKIGFVPDVIFLDLMMRPHDGYEMLEFFRKQANYANSVVIAITARVMTHDLESMQQAGFNGLISKPITRKIFPELLQRIIDGESIWYIA